MKVDEETKTIRLPKLLLWYGSDFGGNVGEILAKIGPMMSTSTTTTTSSMIEMLISNKTTLSEFKVEYNEYDWSLNERR